MKRSYLFQSWRFAARQAVWGLAIQVACTFLFALVATLLHWLGMRQEGEIAGALAATLPAVIVAHYRLYQSSKGAGRERRN